MLVCAGCIQEGDDAIGVCASRDACARCGVVPVELAGSAGAFAPALFRVRVVEPAATLDLPATEGSGP